MIFSSEEINTRESCGFGPNKIFYHRSSAFYISMAQTYEKTLEALLKSQNSHEFSILKLSEPISGPVKQNSGERTSDVSADVFENPSPASLEADLAHYKV